MNQLSPGAPPAPVQSVNPGFAEPSLPLLPKCDLVLRCAMWALRLNLPTYHLQIKLGLNIRGIKVVLARITNWRDFYSILTRHKYKNEIKQRSNASNEIKRCRSWKLKCRDLIGAPFVLVQGWNKYCLAVCWGKHTRWSLTQDDEIPDPISSKAVVHSPGAIVILVMQMWTRYQSNFNSLLHFHCSPGSTLDSWTPTWRPQ